MSNTDSRGKEPGGGFCLLSPPGELTTGLIARLGAEGFKKTVHVSDQAALLAQLQATNPAGVVVTDIEGLALPALVQSVRRIAPLTRLLALSADARPDHLVACMQAGADDFLALERSAELPARLQRLALQPATGPRPTIALDARFKTLADSAPALVWVTDESGDFIHFNQSWLDFTGRTPEAEQGQGWVGGLYPDDQTRVVAALKTHFKVRQPLRIEFRLRRRDGVYRWMLCQGMPHYESPTSFTGYIGSCLDTSDQHEAQTLLAYRAITQAALAGFGRYAIALHPLQDLMSEASRLICDTLQLTYSEVLLFENSSRSHLRISASSGFPADFVHREMSAPTALENEHLPFTEKDEPAIFPGRENHTLLKVRSAIAAPVNDGRRTIGFLTGLSSDTREFGREAVDFLQSVANILSTVQQRERAESALQASEQKLLQSQKMEAVGQLAGGVAHDFNNLLTAMRCYGDILHEELATVAPELQAKTAEILKATARASALTRQLLAFSRKQILQPEVLDMNGVIADLRDLVRSLLSENVAMNVVLTEADAWFEADRNQVDQVVLNLCLNARDAMPQGGVLTLEITLISVAGPHPHNLTPGPYVQLTIRDTGTGMPLDVQEQLFQPFFTTKPVGRGTGLGLATCAVIVKNCHGVINFDSEVGKGTSFHVFLPQIEAPRQDFYKDPEENVLTGNERILMVEDDEPIREITQAILGTLGYTVVPVAGSSEAIELFKTEPMPVFDLLLTDVIMPGMDGLTLATHLREHYQPDLRIMFMSGYVGSTKTVQAVEAYNLPFLEKPFTMNALARKVRETLDADMSPGLPPTD